MNKEIILKSQIETTISKRNSQNIKIAVFSMIQETIGKFDVERSADIKTALGEALENVVQHAYQSKKGRVEIYIKVYDDKSFDIKVRDFGCGIKNIKKAMEPLSTTKPKEGCSGMGFVFMEVCSKKVTVESTPEEGTTVTLEF